MVFLQWDVKLMHFIACCLIVYCRCELIMSTSALHECRVAHTIAAAEYRDDCLSDACTRTTHQGVDTELCETMETIVEWCTLANINVPVSWRDDVTCRKY